MLHDFISSCFIMLILTVFFEEYKLWTSPLFQFFPLPPNNPALFCPLGLNILLSTLLSYTLSLCPSLIQPTHMFAIQKLNEILQITEGRIPEEKWWEPVVLTVRVVETGLNLKWVCKPNMWDGKEKEDSIKIIPHSCFRFGIRAAVPIKITVSLFSPCGCW
jgi:hypothetical protein